MVTHTAFRQLVARLWDDDLGGVLSAEYTLLGGVVVFGTLPGLIAARDRLNAGLSKTTAPLDRVVQQAYSIDIPPPSAGPAAARSWPTDPRIPPPESDGALDVRYFRVGLLAAPTP